MTEVAVMTVKKSGKVGSTSNSVEFNHGSVKTKCTLTFTDVADTVQRKSYCFISFIAATVYIADVVSDGLLAYSYFKAELYMYFGLTFGFLILPAVMVNTASTCLYFGSFSAKYVSGKVWTFRLISHLFGLGPAYREFEITHFGWTINKTTIKNVKNNNLYYMIIDCIKVNSWLRLMASYVQAMPQLILQIAILAMAEQNIRFQWRIGSYVGPPCKPFENATEMGVEIGANDINNDKLIVPFCVLSIATSFMNIGWSLTTFNRHALNPLKERMNCAIVFKSLWNIITLSARLLAAALFASAFTFWCAVAFAIRWIFMFFLGLTVGEKTSKSKRVNALFQAIMGYTWLFAFISTDESLCFRMYIFYHSYEIIEGCLFLGLWAWIADPLNTWFYWPVLVGWIGVQVFVFIFMFIFYVNKCKNAQLYSKRSDPD